MAESTVTLHDGLKLGEHTYYEAVIREATAGDVMDAQEASEKLVFAPSSDGSGVEPTLVTSPSKVSTEVLRRQIKRVGEISGPLSAEQLRKLSPGDMNRLMQATEELDGAAVNETQGRSEQRGRDNGGRPESE